MSMLTFLTKIIGCIHRFSRKRTYICTSLVSENRMALIISPQTGFHQEYLTKHIVMFEKRTSGFRIMVTYAERQEKIIRQKSEF